MLRAMTVGICVAACAAFNAPAAAELLWDNNIEHVDDGSSGRAISPPVFPDIRVADDFTVPAGEVWHIDTLIAGILEDAEWEHGGLLSVLIYADTGGDGPGMIVEEVVTTYQREFTGRNIRKRDYYLYTTDSLDLSYGPGTYWLGIRHPNGGGIGTAYWVSDNGGDPPGGRDGQNSDTAWFSLDAGDTWRQAGAGWQHGFQLHGVPAPSAIALLVLCAMGSTRRRS